MIDWIYLLPVLPLLVLELVAAFDRRRKWETITEIIQRFERRSKVNRILIAVAIVVEFTHLVLGWP